MPKCQRCQAEANPYVYSWYNDQRICFICSEAEKKRPDYEECRKAERDAVSRGDLNFNFKPNLGKTRN